MMRYHLEIKDNEVVVNLGGAIYMDDAVQLRTLLLHETEKHNQFRLNLTDLTYIDSSGLGTFVALFKRVLPAGGQVTLVGVNGPIRELLEITQLTKIFTIV